jgi:lysophospholipase L1-like esterase
MADDKIPYVDPLPALKKSVGEGLYTSSAGDMHPNRNGYRVIGEAVADYLKHADTGKQPAASH